MSQCQLAQLNIARMVALLEEPPMASFEAQLDRINAVADESPGFVWRLKDEDGDATEIQAFDDPLILVNMSVWESLEALRDFVLKSDNMGLLRNRRGWFLRQEGPTLVLWWVEKGHQPLVEEAKQRLELLAKNGPTADAFDFRTQFTSP